MSFLISHFPHHIVENAQYIFKEKIVLSLKENRDVSKIRGILQIIIQYRVSENVYLNNMDQKMNN